MPGIEISGYRPGDAAAVIAAHMDYYGPNWGFGRPFEAKLSTEIGTFLAEFDENRDLLLIAKDNGFAGSIAISGGNHLRWFIVSKPGRGLGGRLIEQALRFADSVRGDKPIYLTTFEGLDAAEALYVEHGFRMVAETKIDQWSGGVTERRFERA